MGGIICKKKIFLLEGISICFSFIYIIRCLSSGSRINTGNLLYEHNMEIQWWRFTAHSLMMTNRFQRCRNNVISGFLIQISMNVRPFNTNFFSATKRFKQHYLFINGPVKMARLLTLLQIFISKNSLPHTRIFLLNTFGTLQIQCLLMKDYVCKNVFPETKTFLI